MRTLKGKGARSVALVVDQPDWVEAVSEGALLGAWEADKYKSDPKKNDKQVGHLHARGSRRRRQGTEHLIGARDGLSPRART